MTTVALQTCTSPKDTATPVGRRKVPIVAMEFAPERGVPRLFVGNLVSSIGDDALRRTLSRYGTVRSIERHPDYAHVSILPKDDSALDKCVAALHRTKWQGTELRVERAREHWADKLRREWDDEKAGGPKPPIFSDVHPVSGENEMYAGKGKGSLSYKFKGARTLSYEHDKASDVSICNDEDIMARFDDDDTVMLGRTPGLEHGIVDGQVTDESDCDKESMGLLEEVADIPLTPIFSSATGARMPALMADKVAVVGDEATDAETGIPAQIQKPEAASTREPPMKEEPSAAVASTFELFGLTETPAPAEPPQASAKRNTGNPENQRSEAPSSLQPKKRPRTEAPARDDGYDAAAMAAESDPAVMDQSRERALARDVLASLFPSEIIAAAPGETAGAKELDRIASMLRRPALFRDVLAKSKRSDVPAKARPVPVRGAAKRLKRFSGKSSAELGLKPRAAHDDVRCGQPSDSGSGQSPALRAGLFRTLLSGGTS